MNDELPTPPLTRLAPPDGAFELVAGRARARRRRSVAMLSAGTTVVIALFAAVVLAAGGSSDDQKVAVADDPTTTTTTEAGEPVLGSSTTAVPSEPTTTAEPAAPETTTTTEPLPPETTIPLTAEQVACQAPDGPDLAEAATTEEATARWMGTWVNCATWRPEGGYDHESDDPVGPNPNSVFCSDEAAIEIVADGTWFNLDRVEDGTFVRRTMDEQHGTWVLFDMEPGYGTARQFELHKVSGYVIAWPTWEQDVARVHLDNNGVCHGTYVRAGG